MSTVVSYNGSSYTIPSEGDSNWSDNVTNYLIALASGSLTKAGGSFALTAEVDFGSNFGLKSIYLKSKAATNPASSGFVRLGNAESVKWRNAANNADLDLTVNSSNSLQFNGSSLAISGNILNADINALAAIDYSKLNLSTSIVNSDISTSAAIAYSKLNLSGSILNADINASAAIAYSKLNLSNSILNADINSSAAIALSKLAALTTGKALQSNASTGVIEASSVTNTELSRLSGIGSSAVGISDTQVLTNKDIDGGTAANTRRLTLPKDTLTNLTSLTRKQGTLVFDTTSNKPYYDDGSNLRVIGSGSGAGGNLIDDGDAEAGTSNYVEGSYSAATRPSGTFTSSSGSGAFAITTSSSSPLSGNNSFVLTKSSGASRQGRAVERTINLDLENRAKVLEVRIKYIVNSGSFVAGSSSSDSSLIWYIGQYNGSTWTYTEPSSFKMLSSSTSISDVLIGNFQTNYDTTQVKLIAYVAESTNSAWEVKCEVAIQPCNYVYGTPITDWVSYTPTITVGSGSITNYTATGMWRRVGDVSQIRNKIAFSGASAVFSGINSTLPSGQVIDTTKSIGNHLGTGTALDAGTAYYDISVKGSGTTAVVPYVTSASGSYSTSANISNTVPFTFGASDVIDYEYSVSITGWSSSTQVSDGSLVKLSARVQTASQAVTAVTQNQITFTSSNATINDSSMVGTNQITITSPGEYDINIRAQSQTVSSSEYVHVFYKLNGGSAVLFGTSTGSASTYCYASGFEKLNLVAGDVLTFFVQTGIATTIYTPTISVSKKQSPQTMSATERISARYENSVAQSIPASSTTNNTVVDFATKKWDTHNAVSGTGSGVGGSWKFTAPVAGEYEISLSVRSAGGSWSAGSEWSALIFKNGTYNNQAYYMCAQNTASYSIASIGTQSIELNAGEYISVGVYQNSGGARNTDNNPATNWIEIKRIK